MPLQSRNTPRKDAPPQAAADDPPSAPREWLIPRIKEFADTATTSMVKREALTGPSSVSRASSAAGVSG
jgi:hypothetical protein